MSQHVEPLFVFVEDVQRECRVTASTADRPEAKETQYSPLSRAARLASRTALVGFDARV